ncbi:glycoprotease family-domain-containing protein [Lipomyces chichibuensis]|uniref:glycoprotease family-domain-containing protein n=1 Tax=Lipomyces chichibuensis TaxID=1546026 RepID=UPI00334355F7
MAIPRSQRPRISLLSLGKNTQHWLRRTYIVLGIETSCDDTSVCLYDRYSPSAPPKLISSLTSSLDNKEFKGIVPTRALNHHQVHLAPLVCKLLRPPNAPQIIPELICVTRGPGMRGSLSVGVEFAKGLSLAWGIPMVGVHHMLAHLLTPRLLTNGSAPRFPFLSLLVSGGHTMLVLSASLLDHRILANTIDIAMGDAIDKSARELGLNGNMNGPELEKLVQRYEESVAAGENKALSKEEMTEVGIKVKLPMRPKPGRPQTAAFSFSSFVTMVKRGVAKKGGFTALSETEVQIIAKQIQDAIFDHAVDRITYTLSTVPREVVAGIQDFVCSGGVGSNLLLRKKLIDAFSNTVMNLHFPPPDLCTDNGRMIAWTGIEMWETAGLHSSYDIMPTAEWNLENILGDVDGWLREDRTEQNVRPSDIAA